MCYARVLSRIKQGLGVGASAGGKQCGHPSVAAEVRFLAQSQPNKPHDRVPPIEPADDQLGPAHPVVAAPKMRQLVVYDGLSAYLIKLLPQLSREDQVHMLTAPEHR